MPHNGRVFSGGLVDETTYQKRGWDAVADAHAARVAARNDGERLAAQLIADIADGLRVLNTIHALSVSESVIGERARGIAAALLGNYRIEERT